MDSIEDHEATLVRMVGTVIFSASRSQAGGLTPFNTETVRFGWGLISVDDENGTFPNPMDATGLGDERWLYTTQREIHIVGHPTSYWNATLNLAETRWSPVHSAPYPLVIDFDVRAQRKFSEPTFVMAILRWDAASPLIDPDSIGCEIAGRALFKAT